ncbi:hypothetical protein ACQKWADRAFT_295722 [Trichoderma austrokoningii]
MAKRKSDDSTLSPPKRAKLNHPTAASPDNDIFYGISDSPELLLLSDIIERDPECKRTSEADIFTIWPSIDYQPSIKPKKNYIITREYFRQSARESREFWAAYEEYEAEEREMEQAMDNHRLPTPELLDGEADGGGIIGAPTAEPSHEEEDVADSIPSLPAPARDATTTATGLIDASPRRSPRIRRTPTPPPKKRPQTRKQRKGRGRKGGKDAEDKKKPRGDEVFSPAAEKFLRSKRSSRRDTNSKLWHLGDDGKACSVSYKR